MLDLLLKNCTLFDQTAAGQKMDVAVHQGHVTQIADSITEPARRLLDLDGRLLVPGFVESHMHLDLALMNDDVQEPGRDHFFTSPTELNAAMLNRRRTFTRASIAERAGRALDLATRHGITALRAQCHVDPEVGLTHLEGLLDAREKYQSRIDLQIVTFPQLGLADRPDIQDLMRAAFKSGADVMGCASNLDPVAQDAEGIRRHIDTAFDLAMQAGVDLDAHADLGLPRRVGLEDLEVVHLARRTIANGYQGRVAAGHVCALDSADPQTAIAAIDLIREAQISVISQPDMYRLGRADQQGVRRGLTRVRQLLQAGVNVTFASNNVRDAYRPLGNLNLLEEGLILSYGAFMDAREDLQTLLRMCTFNAAKALRLPNYGIYPGSQADLVVLNANCASEAIARQAEKLYIFKNGALIAANWQKSELY